MGHGPRIAQNMMMMKKMQRLMLILGGVSLLSFLILFSNRVLSEDHNPTSSHKTRINSQSEFHLLMDQRVSLIEHHCSNRSRRANIKTGQDLYPLHEKSLLWCPVYKAASSNWFYNLLPLSGLSEFSIKVIREENQNLHPNMLAREVAPVLPYHEIKEILLQPGSARLMIVRHPFDRLVSAFRDKLERIGDTGWDYYHLYGKKIVKNYRDNALERFGEEFFTEENYFGAPFLSESRRTADLPSWWEFVKWILDSRDHPERFDVHWRPASVFCSVCVIPYNFILHFENIEEEEKYFVDELHASDVIKPRWENRNDMGLPKEDIVNTYFSLLDEEDVVRLYELYEDDFLMFGYQFKFNWLTFNYTS